MANLSNINNKFLVTTGGNVLIGQTSAVGSSILQVTGNSTFAGSVTSAGNIIIESGNKLFLNNSINTASGSIVCPGGGSLSLQSYGNDMIYLNENAEIRFLTSTVERMRIDSSGNVKIATPITNAFYGLSLQYNATDTADFTVNQATGQIKIGGTAAGYFPTFYSAGTERMRITSTGNIGISGDTSAWALGKTIQINGNYGTINYNGVSAILGIINAYYNGSAYIRQNVGYAGSIDFNTAISGGGFAFRTENTTGAAGDTVTLSTKMAITSAGNVGIGTTTPRAVGSGYKGLEVSSPSSGSSLWLSGFSDTTKGYLAMDTGGLNLTAISNHSLTFGTNNSPKMTILSGGNVGIGATSPSSKLQVGDGTTNVNVKVFGSATSGIQIHTASGNIASLEQYFGDEGSLWLRKGATTKVLVRADGDSYFNGGNVGIGLLLPTKKFEVNSGTISDIVRFGNDAGGIVFGYSTNLASIDLIASQAFRIRQGSTTPLYIKSDGNVGIGETAPASKLTVRKDSVGGRGGEISIVNYSSVTVGNEAALNFGLESSTYDADNGNAQIKARVNNASTAATDMIFSTWNGSAFGERMSIGSTGRINMYGLDAKGTTGSDVRFNTSTKELYYLTSSKRYKTNIVNLENSLDKINALRPVRFKDIKTGEDACGLIAEETFEIIPDVVFTKEIEGFDEPQIEGLNYSDLVPFLIKSIQELKAEIDELKK